jgi:stage II sporulation protein D
MKRSSFLALLLCLTAAQAVRAQNAQSFGPLDAQSPLDAESFSVLGLFHPHELQLQPFQGSVLSVSSGDTRIILNGEAAHRRLVFRAEGNRVVAEGRSASGWTVTAREDAPVPFELAVPGKLRRDYRGRLVLTAHNDELQAVVIMDRETAVASVVAAEMPAAAPLEALKAQAVVARSFFAALASGGRHIGYDFCDTTHCQFLRSPPAAGSPAAQAAEATRGLVLSYLSQPLAALYSSRCGGQTRSLREAGMNPGEGYPYYPVRCAWCQSHPQQWQSRIPAEESAPQPGNEPDRIRKARLWGWSTLPGSDFTAARDGSAWVVDGHSIGHGVGMCQAGAMGMAASGASFRDILRHYYPNTEIHPLP